VSRGEEQVIAALSGTGSVDELIEALPDNAEIDAIPLASGEEYGRRRVRQRFLTSLATGLGLLAAIGTLIPIVGFLRPPAEPLAAPDLVRVAMADELPPNSAKRVHFHERPVLLVHVDAQRYFALSALCTHMDSCQLEWDRDRGQIVCPCHGCVFDLHGNVVQGSSSYPLATYAVEHLGEAVYIRRES